MFEPQHEPGRIVERERPAPQPARPPVVTPGPMTPTNVLALQRGAGNAAVSGMLGGRRTASRVAPSGLVQRAPKVEYTPAPHVVPLGGFELLPGIPPKRRDFVPKTRAKHKLADGSFAVAGIPLGYHLETDAEMGAGIEFHAAPAMLTDIELIAHGEEADRLREKPPRDPFLHEELGPPLWEPPKPRGTLEGRARLRFGAGVSLDAHAEAKLSGGVDAFSKAVSAGAYGKIHGGANATAMLNVDNLVFLTWQDGAISLRSDTIPGFWLGFDLNFAIRASAGVYVELGVPEIPVVSSLYKEVESWPGVGWFLPDLSRLHWRHEYGKSWELAAKKYHHNIPLDLAIGGKGVEPVIGDKSGPEPDAMLNEAGQKQKEELKDDPEGPGEKKLKGDAGAMADAKASAKAQLASTREIVNREKSVTAALLPQARRTMAAAPSTASAGGVQMAAIDPPGGGNADDTPVKQLEERKDALADVDTKLKHLERANTDLQAPAADPDGPTRNETQLALETVAKNADALGDKVNEGTDMPARPTETGNPADAAAEKELGDLEPETLSLLDDVSDAIGTERETLKALAPPSNAPAGRAYKEGHDAYRKAIKKATDQSTTLKRDVEAAQRLRLSDPAGAVKQFKALRDRAGKLQDAAKALPALRPTEPPPGSWFGFKAEFNDAFRARLRAFRGTDNLEPSDQGGEGAVFRDAGDRRVLKRWYGERLGDMRRSVRLLEGARAAVEGHPVLSQYVHVVAIYDKGADWIERDWVVANQTVGRAAGAGPAVNAVSEAIEKLRAAGSLPEALEMLRQRIKERSENLRWDGQRIVVVDMM